MHHHLLHLLRPAPLCLYSSMSVGRHRTCSCFSVPPYTSMLGGTRPSTAALLINRISNNVADAPQSKLLSSTRLPFTPTHLKSLGFKPSPPHLALLSLFFLLSVVSFSTLSFRFLLCYCPDFRVSNIQLYSSSSQAAGAMFSLAVICLPTIAVSSC